MIDDKLKTAKAEVLDRLASILPRSADIGKPVRRHTVVPLRREVDAPEGPRQPIPVKEPSAPVEPARTPERVG
jgi:hypothetical protein